MRVSTVLAVSTLGIGLLLGGRRAAVVVRDRLSDHEYLAELKLGRGRPKLGAQGTGPSGPDAPPRPATKVRYDRKSKATLLVCVINAADKFGVAVAGVKAGDTVVVESVDGLAAIDKGKGKPIKGVVTVAAKADEEYATTAGVPELSQAIERSEKIAKDNFAGELKGRVRDGYGKENGKLRRKEGGVLVCMPEAGGVFYASKPVTGADEGERTDDRQPDHMRGKGAFFPIRDDRKHNTRVAKRDGMVHVITWDSQFVDNCGYYIVVLQIIRGD